MAKTGDDLIDALRHELAKFPEQVHPQWTYDSHYQSPYACIRDSLVEITSLRDRTALEQQIRANWAGLKEAVPLSESSIDYGSYVRLIDSALAGLIDRSRLHDTAEEKKT